MGMNWLSLLSVGTTGVCVLLIILTLVVLWVYVTLSHGRIDHQRNFSVLFEPPQKLNVSQQGNKKTQKNKGKNKQTVTVARLSLLKTATVSSEPQPHKVVSSDGLESKGTIATKRSHEGKNQQLRGKKPQGESKPNEEDDHREPGEGEWQTQLSRRALKHKQRQSEAVEKQSASDDQLEKIPTKEIPNGHQPQNGVGDGDNISPELSYSAYIPAGDVENALREAACSSLSSAEESKSTTVTSAKKSRRRKKSRKKTMTLTKTPVSKESGDVDNHDGWVVV